MLPGMSAAPIRVKVLLFATYADAAGQDEVTLSLSGPATVADVVRQLRQGPLGPRHLPERPLAAVNQVHARADTPLADGDEVALLPPLAGG